MDRLRALQPGHLRFDLRFSRSTWRPYLINALESAEAIHSACFVALHFTEDFRNEFSDFLLSIQGHEKRIGMIGLFQDQAKTTPKEIIRFVLSKTGSGGFKICAGTDAFFAELNRDRSMSRHPVHPVFSINPQVHACDNVSIMDTLEAQPDTVKTAQSFSTLPVVISPVTLKMGWNPNATAPQSPGRLETTTDPRQMTWFCASWTLGSLARLMPMSNLAALTYFKTTGPEGLMEQFPKETRLDAFPSKDGEIYPVYHVFENIAGCLPLPAPCNSNPELVAALGLISKEGQPRLLLANLSEEPQTLEVKGCPEGLRFEPLFPNDCPESISGFLPNPSRYGCIDLNPYALVKLVHP